ncbi:response regulator [Rhodococcus oryzae]|uniref:response regulator n=1 Tax=Rhodococcus oryzae TaxID=2571143 RepID=UPI00371208CF
MRIVIAEDNAIRRDGLAQLLIERGFHVDAMVGDAHSLGAAGAEFRPDVAVVDVRMPPTFTDDGLVEAVALRRSYPDVGVLVFSQWVETRYASEPLARAEQRVWGTYSRTASPMSASSSTPSSGSHRAVPRLIPRSSRN